jgi:hypothetical protein
MDALIVLIITKNGKLKKRKLNKEQEEFGQKDNKMIENI